MLTVQISAASSELLIDGHKCSSSIINNSNSFNKCTLLLARSPYRIARFL